MEQWHDFNVAMLGAAAALAGLVIVAASVNIGAIVKSAALTARLGSGIAGLVLAIVACALALMPSMELAPYGIAVFVLALIASAFSVQAARRILQDPSPESRWRSGKAALGFLAPGCYAIGGVLVFVDPGAGVTWIAAGAMVAIVAALLVSWVVLVEVLR